MHDAIKRRLKRDHAREISRQRDDFEQSSRENPARECIETLVALLRIEFDVRLVDCS